ncbi:hypothetical protein T440DRAFT_545688 [Plenodomus tracheiphilus IPT5]|uniref:SET domain-containing protein n=1 Tax=Plenodomus tracheiphilus IPT5 TaxID=1408161 RepID=A0A6A7AP53_9PLEO|nr:hypothetical protein T440DRAFT_545688 [Plenodomus tracheiphilus IPT5]
MDVHDVGKDYAQILSRQKQMLQEAKKRQGQRPQHWRGRDEMYMSFMMAIMGRTTQKGETNMVHTSFVPPSYLPCSTPLAALQPINIRELRVETHHRGTYLMVRAITPPSRMTGIMVLVEDEREHVVMLQLYQQDSEMTRAAKDIVNVGTVMILKEPFFKLMASGEYGLRVDHLADVVEIGDYDPRRPIRWRPRVLDEERTVESLKLDGNEAVSDRNYWRAIQLYTAALLQCPTVHETQIVKRNRALALLKTGQFDAVLSDVNYPDFGAHPSDKAMFRAAEALYELRRYDEAHKVLELLVSSFPSNARAQEVLKRVRSRCGEQSSGNYNFKRLQEQAQKLRPPRLEHATYVGPVEVRQAAGKGRGLFLTQGVRTGDLLVCEKAFSYAWVDDRDQGSSTSSLLLSIDTGRGFAGGQADLISTIVQTIHRNPSLGNDFRALHHGDYESVKTFTVDDTPIVDTFLVEGIMSYNVFGCPDSSLNTHKDVLANMSKQPAYFGSCGIWLQASYLNHSCVGNVRRSFIGDMMVVRACRNLAADTELTFAYHSPDGISFKELQEKLRSWEFTCNCAMCNDARETKSAVFVERKRLQAQLKQLCGLLGSRTFPTKKFERLLNALDATYVRPATEVPRLMLWDPQILLVRFYSSTEAGKCMEWISKVLSTLGFVFVGADLSNTPFAIDIWGLVIDHLVEVFVHAMTVFISSRLFNDSKKAEEYAKMAYKIVVGEDCSFKSVHGI